ncbi:FAD-dependent oxidoreductase [Leucobacter sp. UCD-THU]|uniref:flavin-containing monooxygenase n=1 Tax=unclassified Leucobacter TaxID=2621730 RepID=UPI00045F6BF4|nr:MULTISPECIES: NAD(P)/FAD-dependent oxidoreductase [unclassified Leucobacter]EYT56744.1 FAD-dependent oxidoreductase [Leucobacter sp. UCD-THU]RGE16847.1 NAD(P)/FAD-dependent oxidoreductase [Leucobacter sp. wl10]
MRRGRLLVVGGGQSGLAAARAGRERGWEPVVLEAGPEPVGSWPRYYDSLRLFSPRRFSTFPGFPFLGPPDGYPSRDEVTEYLRGYAAWLEVDIRTNARVLDIAADGEGFAVELADASNITGDAVVAATGSFENPHLPKIPGNEKFVGEILHVADYRAPGAFANQRVLVVGAGNSAIQIAYELAQVSQVSLVVRDRIRFASQQIGSRDLHWWLTRSRFDRLPPKVLNRIIKRNPVIDAGAFRAALATGALDQQPMFRSFTSDGVTWASGREEKIDAVIFATGYRPNLPYLDVLGALDQAEMPRHRGGVSTRVPGLGFLGLEFQRSFASNTLRGVHRDATLVVTALTNQ